MLMLDGSKTTCLSFAFHICVCAHANRSILPGWTLQFDHRGGMGNIRPVPPPDTPADAITLPDKAAVSRDLIRQLRDHYAAYNWAEVHGVCHRLPYESYQRLRRAEDGYDEVPVTVRGEDGRDIECVAFVSKPGQLLPSGSLPPPARYLGLLCTGARDWSMDARYTAWLDGMPRLPNNHRGPEYYDNPGGSMKHGQHKEKKEKGGAQRRGGRGGKRGEGGSMGTNDGGGASVGGGGGGASKPTTRKPRRPRVQHDH